MLARVSESELWEQRNGDQLSGMNWPQQDRVKAGGGVTHDLLHCFNKLTQLTLNNLACWTNSSSKETHLSSVMNWAGSVNSPVVKWTPDITDVTWHCTMQQTSIALCSLAGKCAISQITDLRKWPPKLIITPSYSAVICIHYKFTLSKWPCWAGHLRLLQQIGPNKVQQDEVGVF